MQKLVVSTLGHRSYSVHARLGGLANRVWVRDAATVRSQRVRIRTIRSTPCRVRGHEGVGPNRGKVFDTLVVDLVLLILLASGFRSMCTLSR